MLTYRASAQHYTSIGCYNPPLTWYGKKLLTGDAVCVLDESKEVRASEPQLLRRDCDKPSQRDDEENDDG